MENSRQSRILNYRLMDESLILPVCLHGGGIKLSQLDELTSKTHVEEEFGLPYGIHSRFFKEVSRSYGACGMVAIDDDEIIGLTRSCPKMLMDMLGTSFCPQEEDAARRIGSFDTTKLPQFDELSPKSLRIHCFQVIEQYRSQGIGKTMLQKTINWAKENGWSDIFYSGAFQHIFPLISWAGGMSVQSLMKLGFEVISQRVDEGVRGGVISQRRGYHGEDVKKVWEEKYSHISDDEASVVYTMKLSF